MVYEKMMNCEECFKIIFHELNMNKKSINNLNNIVITQRNEIEELKNEIEDLKKENLKNINKKINAKELKEEIKKEIKRRQNENIVNKFDNLNKISNLNVKVEENIINDIIELKELKNNLHFSYIISNYTYHINYLRDIVKLEIDLFGELINNNILPINFIRTVGNVNATPVIKYITDNSTSKDELIKYLNDNDIINNKYNFTLEPYIWINDKKAKDVFGHFPTCKKNTHNKYAIKKTISSKYVNTNTTYIIPKNTYYHHLYDDNNNIKLKDNDFLKMLEMKEDTDELEELILNSLERYEFMKNLKTLSTKRTYLNDKNTIYLNY